MTDNVTRAGTPYQDAIRNNVWMHMAPHQSLFNGGEAPVIVRGEGHHIFDDKGKKYLDGLAGLFTVQVGHGREEIAKAMYDQTLKLPFMPLWSFAHPQAIEVSERLASFAPGDLNRVFLTSGGGDSVESAMKLAKNYFKLTGKPGKHKIISRATAYHGTPHGALSVTSLPGLREQFAPLVPGAMKVPNTNFYRSPEPYAHDEKAFGRWAADRIGEAIEFEGADSVAAVFLEPVQNSGGCFPPPPGYFDRVREICDEYDVLLVSDETICAYGRIGDMYACNDFGYVPDIITSAKGITSGYAPLGAMVASDRLFEPFGPGGEETFYHGYTFGGHPVACAAAMANFDVFESEKLNDHVHENAAAFKFTLEKLKDLPIVGDVRGEGFFYGIELVKDRDTKESFTEEESERILKNFVSAKMYENGLYCRADDRGDPVIQLSPPLTVGQAEFDEMEQIIRSVLTEAWTMF